MSMPISPNDSNQTMMNMAMHASFFWVKDVVLLRPDMYILALVVVFLLAVGAENLSVAPVLKRRRVSPAASALLHAVFYACRMCFLYLIMLSVMSFNVGVFVAAVAGHLVGSFIDRALFPVAPES